MIIDEEQLLKLAGLQPYSKAALRKHLKRAGIPFRVLNNQTFTTEEALTATLVGKTNKKPQEPNWDAIDQPRVRTLRKLPH